MNAPPLLLTFTQTGTQCLVTRDEAAAIAAAEREDAAGSRGSLVALLDYFDGVYWPIYPEDADLAASVARFFAAFEGTAEDKAAAVAEGLAALRDNGNTEP